MAASAPEYKPNFAGGNSYIIPCQCLSRRIADKDTLTKEVAAWQRDRNKKHAKADWQFTTADARIKLKQLYPTL